MTPEQVDDFNSLGREYLAQLPALNPGEANERFNAIYEVYEWLPGSYSEKLPALMLLHKWGRELLDHEEGLRGGFRKERQ